MVLLLNLNVQLLVSSAFKSCFNTRNLHYSAISNINKQSNYSGKLKNKYSPAGAPVQVYLERKIYRELYARRRQEATNSVLIEMPSTVTSSSPELEESIGARVTAKHVFTFTNENVYALCELESRQAVESLLSTATFDPSKDTIPVATRLLTCKNLPQSFTTQTSSPPKTSLTLQQHLLKCDNLSQQIDTLHEHDQLTDLAARLRFFVCSTFEDMLTSLFPQCNVLPFGSTVNGFGKNSGDLDMTLSLNPVGYETVDDHEETNTDLSLQFTGHAGRLTDRSISQSSLRTIGHMIDNFLPACDEVNCILNARVPIVRFRQTVAKLNCDMSFCDLSGVRMSHLLHQCSLLHAYVAPLVSCVRAWCKAGHITHLSIPGPWFTNFMLTMLVLHYLQTVQLLPPLHTLLYDSTNPSTTTDTSSQPDQGELFVGFLQFCVDFQFHKKGISLLDGVSTHKHSSCALVIENPLDATHNITKIVADVHLRSFVLFCELTIDLLQQNGSKSNDMWGLAKIMTSSFSKSVSGSRIPRRSLNVGRLFR